MPTATVVGSINKDIVAFVERHPQPGETVAASRSSMFPGGKGANQAVAIARLKADADRVRMVGRVGADLFGTELRDFLAAEGIDIEGIKISRSAGTGLGMITVDARAQNAIAVVPGANYDWPDGLAPLALTPRDIVVCQLEVPLPIVAAAFAAARAARATTVLNPAPYRPVPPDTLADTDILVLNEVEAAQLLGQGSSTIEDKALIPAARTLIAAGPHTVIVTLGAAGVLLVERDGRVTRIPGRSVAAVDTTGAGDCFVGALVAALMRDEPMAMAVTFANAAAAISVTRPGAASAIPRRDEVVL